METVEFGELYERYARDVLRFAWYLTGNRSEAEDITSETFVRAWVESDRLRVDTVKAYLFMIARNLHIDWRRLEGDAASCRRSLWIRRPALTKRRARETSSRRSWPRCSSFLRSTAPHFSCDRRTKCRTKRLPPHWA